MDFSDLGKTIEGLLNSLIEKDDENFIKTFTIELTKYLTLAKTGTGAQKKRAEETVNDLLLTAKLKLAQRQIKARRGLKGIVPQVLETIFDVAKSAS